MWIILLNYSIWIHFELLKNCVKALNCEGEITCNTFSKKFLKTNGRRYFCYKWWNIWNQVNSEGKSNVGVRGISFNQFFWENKKSYKTFVMDMTQRFNVSGLIYSLKCTLYNIAWSFFFLKISVKPRDFRANGILKLTGYRRKFLNIIYKRQYFLILPHF